MKQDTLILIVEDDDSLREALCETLDIAGYSTVAADSAPQALDILQQQRVNLIFCDVQMAGMKGDEFLVHSKQRWPRIPVVLMTAHGVVEQAVTAMQQGAADYISKPFEAEVLLETVARLAQAPAQRGNPCIRGQIQPFYRRAGAARCSNRCVHRNKR